MVNSLVNLTVALFSELPMLLPQVAPSAQRRRCRTTTTYVRLAVEELESRTLLTGGVATIQGSVVQVQAVVPNDGYFKDLWGMNNTGQNGGKVDADIDAPEAWQISQGSTKVVIADIDTGIDYTHQDLYLNLWINQAEIPTGLNLADTDNDGLVTFRDLNNVANSGKVADSNANGYIDGKDILVNWSDGVDAGKNGYIDDLIGWNFVNNTNDPFDDNGHGTHTAGTIGAVGNNGIGYAGVSWQVQIMALKFMDARGSGDLADAAEAIRYAADNGARASNNSWGYTGGKTTDAIAQAISYAGTKGHLVIAAAGNDGRNNDTNAKRNYPASFTFTNIIAVAATDNKDKKASWSNYGKVNVDLAAPGVGIWSTYPGNYYSSMSGTSMATPHVTGAAALLWAVNPNLTAAQVKAALLNSVDKLSTLTTLTASGGRLNVYNALTSIGGLPQASPLGGSQTAGTGTPTGGTIKALALVNVPAPTVQLVARGPAGVPIQLLVVTTDPMPARPTERGEPRHSATVATVTEDRQPAAARGAALIRESLELLDALPEPLDVLPTALHQDHVQGLAPAAEVWAEQTAAALMETAAREAVFEAWTAAPDSLEESATPAAASPAMLASLGLLLAGGLTGQVAARRDERRRQCNPSGATGD